MEKRQIRTINGLFFGTGEKKAVSGKNFELRVAWRPGFVDRKFVLYSYFPTLVEFPLPVLIHGSFDLTGNRNSLENSPSNKEVLEELAQLLVQLAEKIASESQEASWEGMKFLSWAVNQGWANELEAMHFPEQLQEAMKTARIIPLVTGAYATAEESPWCLSQPFAEYLRFPEMKDLALFTDEVAVRESLRRLGVLDRCETGALIEGINRVEERLDWSSRLELIKICVWEKEGIFKWVEPKAMPQLLRDQDKKPIPSHFRALIGAATAEGLTLPDGVPVRILNTEIFVALKADSSITKGRDLAKTFNFHEYSTATFVSAISRYMLELANMAVDPLEKERIGQKMMESLHSVSVNFEENIDPKNVTVHLPNRLGEWVDVKSLYLGKEYQGGILMETLFEGQSEVLLAGPEKLGEWALKPGFLTWLGLADLPRNQKLTLQHYQSEWEEYLDYVFSSLQVSHLSGTRFGSVGTLRKEFNKAYSKQIVYRVPEKLTEILNKGNAEAILRWLFTLQSRGKLEGYRSQLEFREKHKQYFEQFDLPGHLSYFLWKSRRFPWVPALEGGKISPDRAFLIKGLEKFPELFQVMDETPVRSLITENPGTREGLEYLLRRLGVCLSFNEISPGVLYDILLKVGTEAFPPETATRIYRLINEQINHEDFQVDENAPQRKTFMETGRIWGHTVEGWESLPPHKVYYADNRSFCQAIIDKFPTLNLPRRSGTQKIGNLFGVSGFEEILYSINESASSLREDLNPVFSKHLGRIKPYMMAYRVSYPATKKDEAGTLRDLEIRLYGKLSATYVFKGHAKDSLELGPYEYLSHSNGNIYCLLVPDHFEGVEALYGDFRFRDAVAEIVSGAIDVGKVRKDFRGLVGKPDEDIEEVLKADLGDPEGIRIREAKQLIGALPMNMIDFWNAWDMLRHGTETFSDLKLGALVAKVQDKFTIPPEVSKSVRYDNLGNPTNYPGLCEIFKRMDCSLSEFNAHIGLAPIYLNRYFEIHFRKIKDLSRNAFLNWVKANLHASLPWSSISDAEKAFRELALPPKIEHLHFDSKAYLSRALDIALSELVPYQEAEDVFLQRTRNQTEFCGFPAIQNADPEDVNEFLQRGGVQEELFYGESVKELATQFLMEFPDSQRPELASKPEETIEFNGKSFVYEGDYDSAFALQLESEIEASEIPLESPDLKAPPARKSRRPNPASDGGKRGKGRAPGGQGQEVQVGMIGEMVVRSTVKQLERFQDVKWVSAYSKALGNKDGMDGLGYDLELYLKGKNEPDLIEVKSSRGGSIEFTLTYNEYQTALQYPDRFRIFFVTNVLNKDYRRVLDLGYPFDFPHGENFRSNGKFRVKNKDFILRFGEVG